LLAREKIIQISINSKPIILKENYFIFPPKIDDIRKRKIKELESNKDTLFKTVEITDKLSNTKLKQINDLNDKIRKREKEIQNCEKSIDEMKKIHSTLPIMRSGDDIIKLLDDGDTTLHSPISKFQIKDISWNCKYTKVTIIDDCSIKVTISPDTVNLKKKEDHRWFIRLWLEYQGELYYKNEILIQEKLKIKLQNDIEIFNEELKLLDDEKSLNDNDLNKHKQNLKAFEKKNKIKKITSEYFNINEIDSIFEILNKDIYF